MDSVIIVDVTTDDVIENYVNYPYKWIGIFRSNFCDRKSFFPTFLMFFKVIGPKKMEKIDYCLFVVVEKR